MCEMDRRTGFVLVPLLIVGCMQENTDDRLAQAIAQHQMEVRQLQAEINERDQNLSRQAAQELELRRRLSQANEQLADLREQQRQLQSKLEAAQQALQAAQKRLDVFDADHQVRLEQIQSAHAQELAERDARVERLNARVRQLEALLARSGAPPASSRGAEGR